MPTPRTNAVVTVPASNGAGIGSLIVVSSASDGPRLVTRISNVAAAPAIGGSVTRVLTVSRSFVRRTSTSAVSVLLVLSSSVVLELTSAMLVTIVSAGGLAFSASATIVIVSTCWGCMSPSVHVYSGAVQVPSVVAALTGMKPAGIRSSDSTSSAIDGPLLVITIV